MMRARMASRMTAVALAVTLAGCGDETPFDPDVLPTATLERALARIAVAALGGAGGRSGAGIFDNALPCARRGVLAYYDTPAGRHLTFHGCDLGANVVLSGAGELRWAGPGLEPVREPFCNTTGSTCQARLRWSGSLELALGGDTTVVLDAFALDDLVMGPDGGRFPPESGVEILFGGFVSVRATAFGRSVTVSDPTLPGTLFDLAGVDPDALPNPAGSPAALTPADLHRLALQTLVDLAFFLVDETLESQRGDHVHDLPCGQTSVTYDVDQRPQMRNTWTACADRGVFVSGDFVLEWDEIAEDRLALRVTGPLGFGGGVASVNLTAVTWSVAGPLPDGEATVTLRLEGAGGIRTLTLPVVFDD